MTKAQWSLKHSSASQQQELLVGHTALPGPPGPPHLPKALPGWDSWEWILQHAIQQNTSNNMVRDTLQSATIFSSLCNWKDWTSPKTFSCQPVNKYVFQNLLMNPLVIFYWSPLAPQDPLPSTKLYSQHGPERDPEELHMWNITAWIHSCSLTSLQSRADEALCSTAACSLTAELPRPTLIKNLKQW